MIKRFITRLARNSKGATAIEYGLILSLIVITMIGAFVEVANATVGMWGNVNTKMERARTNS